MSDGIGFIPFGFCRMILIVGVGSMLSKACPHVERLATGGGVDCGRMGRSKREGSGTRKVFDFFLFL
jgi:hypothetical protein